MSAPSSRSAGDLAGRRAARNTLLRAGAEIVGKLATFVLFAALARQVGASGLGVYVFAFSFLQIALMPIDLGLERYVLRLIARDRDNMRHAFLNAIVLKLLIAVPVVPLSFLALALLGYGHETQLTVWALTAGLLLDSVGRIYTSAFMAHERAGLVAASIVAQRVVASGVGLAVLAAGYGVPTVAGAYTVGAALGLAIQVTMLPSRVELPKLSVVPSGLRSLALASLPFGAQDVLTALLFRADAVLLSLMTTDAAVGRYGAAYRVLESTLFINASLAGAFAAMYTYLEQDSDPPLPAVFQRSIKLALVALTPCAVVFATLAVPLCAAVFGAGLKSAAEPLRLLAPVAVELGLVTLCTSLIVSRQAPGIMVWVTALGVAVNIGLNLLLIPLFDERGAAAAMLLTETVLVVIVSVLAIRLVGALEWRSTLTGPLVAGFAMAAVTYLLRHDLLSGLALGAAAYFMALIVVERLVSPQDLRFATRLVRDRLRPRTAA